jgi:serine phosphatase RsbU (regulator of sigma subunit)
VGFRKSELFQEGIVYLSHGDRLILFTDGLSEAEDAAGDQYGEDRIANFVNQNRSHSSEEILNGVLEAAALHCGSAFSDDATAVVVSAL